MQCVSPLAPPAWLDDLDTSSLVSYLAFLSAVLRDRSPRVAQTAFVEEQDGDEDEDEVVPVLTGALVGGVQLPWLHEQGFTVS